MFSLRKRILHLKEEGPIGQSENLSVTMETEEGEEEVRQHGVLGISKGVVKKEPS